MDIHLSDAPLKNVSVEVGLSGTILALKLIHQLLLPAEWWQLWLLYTLGQPPCCHWVRHLGQICHWYFHGPRVSERASSGRWFPNLITVPLALSTYKWTGLAMSERRGRCEGLYQGLKEPLLNLSPVQRQHSPQGCHRGA